MLLSMLATHNVVDSEREIRGVSEHGGLEECKGAQPNDDPAEGSMGTGAVRPALLGVVFRLVS